MFLLFQSYHFIRANMQNNSLYCWRHAFVSLHHCLKLLLLLSCRDYNNPYLPINYSAMDGTLQVFAFSEDHGHSSISILSVLLFYMNMLFFLLMCFFWCAGTACCWSWRKESGGSRQCSSCINWEYAICCYHRRSSYCKSDCEDNFKTCLKFCCFLFYLC